MQGLANPIETKHSEDVFEAIQNTHSTCFISDKALLCVFDGHSFLICRYCFPEQIKELTSCSVRLFFFLDCQNKLLDAIRSLMLLDDL